MYVCFVGWVMWRVLDCMWVAFDRNSRWKSGLSVYRYVMCSVACFVMLARGSVSV